MRMMVIMISLGGGRIYYMFVEEAAADKKDQKLIIIAEVLMDRLFVLSGPRLMAISSYAIDIMVILQSTKECFSCWD